MIYYCCDKLLINGNNYSSNGRDNTVCSSAVRYFFDVFVSFATLLRTNSYEMPWFALGKAFAFHFFFCLIIYPFTYFKVLFLRLCWIPPIGQLFKNFALMKCFDQVQFWNLKYPLHTEVITTFCRLCLGKPLRFPVLSYTLLTYFKVLFFY